jgi:hypothetical protein
MIDYQFIPKVYEKDQGHDFGAYQSFKKQMEVIMEKKRNRA